MFLLMVPATRNSVLLPLLGVSYDQTIFFHQCLGWSLAILTTLHWIVTWTSWYSGALPLDPVATTFSSLQYTFGFVAWLLVAVTVLVSLPVVRRRHFNVFQRLHYLFIATFALVALHAAPYVVLETIDKRVLGRSIAG